MKTFVPAFLSFIFPLSMNAQIGMVHFVDTSFESAGISHIESFDLNKDGYNEMITSSTGSGGRLGYYQNLANNTFSTFDTIENYAFCRGFAVGDFNRDNWPDLVSIGGIYNEAKIHFSDSGSFSPGVQLDSNISILVNDVAVADFDRDGADDIVIIGQHSIDFYRNNGSGSFAKEVILSTGTSPKSLECLDLAVRDMDNDGDMDLICGETAGLVVYINNGNGVFSPYYYSVVSEIFFLVLPIDIDNDGDFDVVGRDNAGQVKWFSNDGSGVMDDEAILTAIPNTSSLNSIDYNQDGLEDIYVSYAYNVAVFENDSNHSFGNEVTVYQDNDRIMGFVQMADIDRQGDLDYVWSGGNNGLAFHINHNNLSIAEMDLRRVSVFPNPTQGELHSKSNLEKISVYNVSGEKLMERSNTNTIDLSGYPAGVYIVIIKDKNGVFRRRIIKNQ